MNLVPGYHNLQKMNHDNTILKYQGYVVFLMKGMAPGNPIIMVAGRNAEENSWTLVKPLSHAVHMFAHGEISGG